MTYSVAGLIEIVGSLLAGAEINIGGSLTGGSATGNIVIEHDCVGDVDVQQSVSGDICIGNDLTGSVTVAGALSNQTFAGGGRILVGGESSGPIKVGKNTGSLTLIQIAKGLATGATIQVNTTRGNFDAEGDMYIGPGEVLPVPLPFDGCIRIFDDGAAVGGALDGDITIVGCHDESVAEELMICIDGPVNGNVNLEQTGCNGVPATWGCPFPGCP